VHHRRRHAVAVEPVHTRALLLKQVDTGESDRVVTLLTEDLGKISAIARGARRSRKRFGAALALFVLAEAELRTRSTSSLHVLTGYQALEIHAGIGRDIAAITHASYATELVDALCPKGLADPELFELLLEMYGALAEEPATSERLRVFELRILTVVGLAPQVSVCVACGRDVFNEPEGLGMDIGRGGVVCGDCGRPDQAIEPETYHALFELTQIGLADATHLSLSARVGRELRNTMAAYLEYTVGRPLKSVQFIRKLSR
jgi:DNA repair protein RecO (recombination protein O)